MSEARPEIGLSVARVLGALVLLGGTYVVMRPFLVPLAWGAIVAYVTWPLYRRVRHATGRPALASGGFTLAVLLLLGVPVAWFLVILAEQSVVLAHGTQTWVESGAPLPAWLSALPLVGEELANLRTRALPGTDEILAYIGRFGGRVSKNLLGIAGGVATNVFNFALTLVALYALYLDGERVALHARRLIRTLFPSSPDRMLDDVGAVVRAVVFGLIGTALVQGVIASLGLALFGVPSPVALGALTALLSFVPAGPPLVWGGAALWLWAGGHVGAAVGMGLWGLLLVSSVDNVIRPILINRSGSIRIPFLVTLFGVLGGLLAFGFLGLFLGPVLLSVAFALVARVAEPEETAPDVRRTGGGET